MFQGLIQFIMQLLAPFMSMFGSLLSGLGLGNLTGA